MDTTINIISKSLHHISRHKWQITNSCSGCAQVNVGVPPKGKCTRMGLWREACKGKSCSSFLIKLAYWKFCIRMNYSVFADCTWIILSQKTSVQNHSFSSALGKIQRCSKEKEFLLWRKISKQKYASQNIQNLSMSWRGIQSKFVKLLRI